MGTFLKTLVLFLLPLALLFAPSCVVLYQTGEFYSIVQVAQNALQPRTLLYSPAYSNYRAQLQQTATALRHPDTLALGNSRVGEFRGVFFKQPETFYNASGGVGAVSDFKNFLRSLEPYHPKVLIIDMDHHFFNPDEAKNNVVVRPDSFKAAPIQRHDVVLESLIRNGGWWKFAVDFYRGKYSVGDVFGARDTNKEFVGLRAISYNSGATNDGSDYYGSIISSPEIQESTLASIHDLANSIDDTNGDWYGPSISTEALAELRTLLTYTKQHDIEVIGFLPPIAPAEYAAIRAHPRASYADSVQRLAPTLSALYKEYSYSFFDYSNIAAFGGSDHEMVDSKHGSEKMYLRMFIDMAKHSPALSPLVDVAALTTQLQQATSSYIVFGLQGAVGKTSVKK